MSFSSSVTSKPFAPFAFLSQTGTKDDKEKFAQAVEKSDGFSSSASTPPASQSKAAYVDWMKGKCEATEKQHHDVVEIIKTLNEYDWSTTCKAMLMPVSPKLNSSWDYFYKEIFDFIAVFPPNRDVKEAIANIINSFSQGSKLPHLTIEIVRGKSFQVLLTNVSLGADIVQQVQWREGLNFSRLKHGTSFLPFDTCQTFARYFEQDFEQTYQGTPYTDTDPDKKKFSCFWRLHTNVTSYDPLLTAVQSLRNAMGKRINLQKDQHTCDDDIQLRQQAMADAIQARADAIQARADAIQLEKITAIYQDALRKSQDSLRKSQESLTNIDSSQKEVYLKIMQKRDDDILHLHVDVRNKEAALKEAQQPLSSPNLDAAKKALADATSKLDTMCKTIAEVREETVAKAKAIATVVIKADADARVKAEADAKAKIAADAKAADDARVAADAKTKAAADAKIKATTDLETAIENAERMLTTARDRVFTANQAKIAAEAALAGAVGKNALNTDAADDVGLRAAVEKATREKEEANKALAAARTAHRDLLGRQIAANIAAGT